MDVFSHGLWGFAVSYPQAQKQKNPKRALWGLVLGMLPDVIPFLPVQLYFLFNRSSFSPSLFFPEPQHWVFSWAIESYNYTHSLVLFLIALVIVMVIRHRQGRPLLWWPLMAWGLHVLMDIPTHPDFFSTPFLFPLSSFTLAGRGVSWANPWVFGLNWVAIAVTYVWIRRDVRKQSNNITI